MHLSGGSGRLGGAEPPAVPGGRPRIAIGGLIESFSHNGLQSRVLNDRGRVIGGLGALYLHFAPAPRDKEAGLTMRPLPGSLRGGEAV